MGDQHSQIARPYDPLARGGAGIVLRGRSSLRRSLPRSVSAGARSLPHAAALAPHLCVTARTRPTHHLMASSHHPFTAVPKPDVTSPHDLAVCVSLCRRLVFSPSTQPRSPPTHRSSHSTRPSSGSRRQSSTPTSPDEAHRGRMAASCSRPRAVATCRRPARRRSERRLQRRSQVGAAATLEATAAAAMEPQPSTCR